MITISNLQKHFGSKTAIDIEHYDIATGDMLGLVGNNGAGKTTLFRLMLDLLQADRGNVLIDGMRQSLDTNTAHTDVLVAELRGSRDRSKEMGGTVDRIDTTTQHTDTLVEDIHRHIIGGEGTD